MNLKFAILLVAGLTLAGVVFAQKDVRVEDKALGIGVMVGEPTGISLKRWISEDRAVDAGIAWSFSGNDSLHVHADYLFHRFDLTQTTELRGRFPLYFGVGGRIKVKGDKHDHDTKAGVRIPFGMSYLFDDAPIELFGEIVPVLDLVPDTDLDLNAAIGARFYF